MKTVTIIFLSLFLFATQANAFVTGIVAKMAYENIPAKEKAWLKKDFQKKFGSKPKSSSKKSQKAR
ncbi:hypothetical protein [Sulfurospirillum sp. MES]|uniref:hypothetical protein n=1 Tax=Sulfurospirillum sp. MES TaxID=1565314 RepID=UPI0005421A3A|nr:hypothetical protein [Sulfurospirillum sp. MES]KHG32974.1 MAG: hypothetical protein OA34_12305 [Sulfurospirillum sp. MES]